MARPSCSWKRAWKGLRGIELGSALLHELLARYGEPHRRYHTRQHLEECLALFSSVRSLAQRPAEVETAIWFHDAIHDIPGVRNEARSAAWARSSLMQAGVDAAVAERVHALVLATRHDAVPTDPDAQLLVDIDLAILGATPERFAEYERQIREEYAHVPEMLFQQKRKAILQGFLERPRLFSTPELRGRFELQARVNLQRAIAGM